MKKHTGVCHYPLDELITVMERLRASCPWDKAQTHQSLTPYLVEETYEVLEALVEGNQDDFCEELGDLLLQIVFHAQIATERQHFNINDVIAGITRKMIGRHPHVFGDVEVADSDEVLANWDEIKRQEPGRSPKSSVLGGVPKGMPALSKAYKLQTKAAQVGFDWPDYKGAWDKLTEELNEFQQALKHNHRQQMYHELGDILFAVVNMARLLDIDATAALTSTNNKFTRRFQYIEEQAKQQGQPLAETTLEQKDYWWDQAKASETAKKKTKILNKNH